MFNLLPEKDKILLQKEYKFRRSVIYVSAVIVFLILSVGFLVPVFVITYYKYHAAHVQYDSIVHLSDGSEQAYIKDIKRVNGLLGVLKDTNDMHTENIFKLILDAKPSGVRINKLAYIRDTTIRIRIEGVAGDRESLRLFTKNLTQVKGLQASELPISEFVRDSNIPFSLSSILTP